MPYKKYLRTCRRCHELFKTTAKLGKVCEDCRMPNNKYNIPKEVKQYRDKQKLLKLKGAGNKCPKCRKQGFFGAITRYYHKEKMWQVCHWCGHIKYLGTYQNGKIIRKGENKWEQLWKIK